MGTLPPEFFLLLVAIISAIFGGLLIWLVGYINGDKQSNQSSTAATLADPETAPTDEQELLRISRTKKGLAVFVQGQRHGHLREVADSQMGRETIEAIKAVLAFAEGWLPPPRQAPPPPDPEKSAVDQEDFLDQLRQRDLVPSEESSKSPQPEPLPLVEEIDDLVQQRLQQWPEMTGQRIRLASGEDGNLYIYVGQQTFSSVDDISDPQVQALIRDAIREWENS